EPPVLCEVPGHQRSLISVEDDSLPSPRGAYVLKPETELVRPEVGSRSGPRLSAEDRAGDAGRLLGRARPVLETDVARTLGAPQSSDVATGEDTREPRAAAFVRLDRAGGPEQELTGGLGAHRDEDEFAFELHSVREAQPAERPVAPAQHALDPGPEPEGDTVLPVAVGEEAADLRPERQLEREGGQVDDRHVDAELDSRRRNLGADEARSDDPEPPAGDELCTQSPRVVERAEDVDAAASERCRPPGPGSGRENERIPHHVAARRAREPARRVDPLHPDSELEVDLELGPGGRSLQKEFLAGAREELLREGGPLVRLVWLLADECDRSFEPLRAKRLRAAAAREAGPDDDDTPAHQAACLPRSSYTAIAPMGHAAAASRTASSSVSASCTAAIPSGPRKKERDASSAQLPKPLHSDRSISMRYTTLSFRGWDERAPRGGGDHRTDRSAVEAESPGLAAVGSGRQAVHGGEGEDEVRGPVQAPPVARPDALPERERRVDDHHQLGGEHSEPRPQRTVGSQAGHEQAADPDVHRAVEDERRCVCEHRAEPEHGEEAVEVGHRGRLQRRAERARLE